MLTGASIKTEVRVRDLERCVPAVHHPLLRGRAVAVVAALPVISLNNIRIEERIRTSARAFH